MKAFEVILNHFIFWVSVHASIPERCVLRPGTPVLGVIFNKYLSFEFSTGNSFLLLGL